MLPVRQETIDNSNKGCGHSQGEEFEEKKKGGDEALANVHGSAGVGV